MAYIRVCDAFMTKVASSSQRISLVGDTEEEWGWDSVMAIEDGDLGEGQSSVERVDVMRISETLWNVMAERDVHGRTGCGSI